MKKYVLIVAILFGGCYPLPHNYPSHKCNGDKICHCEKCPSEDCAFSKDCKCK